MGKSISYLFENEKDIEKKIDIVNQMDKQINKGFENNMKLNQFE